MCRHTTSKLTVYHHIHPLGAEILNTAAIYMQCSNIYNVFKELATIRNLIPEHEVTFQCTRCLFDTAYSSYGVDELKLKFPNYCDFYKDMTQDTSQCPLYLMDIMGIPFIWVY